jgi:carbonic anhydrase
MDHGSKQSLAWMLAVGLSGTIYGGSTLWLKQAKFATGAKDESHELDHEGSEHGDEEAAERHSAGKHHDQAVAEHDTGHHDSPKEHTAKHEEHAAAEHDTGHHDTSKHATAKDDAPKDHAAKHEEHAVAAHDAGKHEENIAKSADHKPHWTYGKGDASGPKHWGDLAANFSQCEKGMEQSPIDIRDSQYSAATPKIKWHYGKANLAVQNNGHTIQSNLSSGDNYVTIDGEKYNLAQFHFHNPSEHRFAGVPADMEMHFVHKNASGKLAVIGVMINEAAGKENLAFKPVWDILPREANTHAAKSADMKLTSLLPNKQQYIHYKGSLTTPPCSEGVRWFVMKDPITMSSGQLEMYTSIFEGSTSRPVQPLQGREVLSNTPPAMAH